MINLFKIAAYSKFITVNNFTRISSVVRCRHKNAGRKDKDPCNKKPDPLMECACKVALITGGAEGIGLTIAHEILQEKAKHVALLGINNCAGREAVTVLNCTYGKDRAIFYNTDVQSKIQMRECYEKVVKEFGKIDIVVNAAGVFDGANWETEMTTNLVGTMHSMVEVYKCMSRQEGGCGGVVLNFSGIYGMEPLHAAPTLSSVYHGILGLSRSFGHPKTANRTGVRVVTLCPGITDTNFIMDAEKRGFDEAMCKQLQAFITEAPRQKAEACGKAGLYVLKNGLTGSVWVVEGSKLYVVNLPDWRKFRVLESQLI